MDLNKPPMSGTKKLMISSSSSASRVANTIRVSISDEEKLKFLYNQLSRYCNNFRPEHWQSAKNCIAYLKGTASHGLCYGGDGANVSSILIGYSDSDYAGDLDQSRSTTGYSLIWMQ